MTQNLCLLNLHFVGSGPLILQTLLCLSRLIIVFDLFSVFFIFSFLLYTWLISWMSSKHSNFSLLFFLFVVLLCWLGIVAFVCTCASSTGCVNKLSPYSSGHWQSWLVNWLLEMVMYHRSLCSSIFISNFKTLLTII